jgi:hypothetical protein
MMCIICGRRHKNGGAYCQLHARELDKQRQEQKARKGKNAFRYVQYHGHVVGFYRDGDKFRPSYVGMSVNGIQKSRLINLDEYCEGYTREQVKRLKVIVLRLANIKGGGKWQKPTETPKRKARRSSKWAIKPL